MVKRFGNILELGQIEAVSGTFSASVSAPTVTGTTGQFSGSLSAQNGSFSTSLTISGIPVSTGTGGGGGLQAVVDDTVPQLGGNLDVNGFSISSAGGNNITIASANGLTATASNGNFSSSATGTSITSSFGKNTVRSVTDETLISGTSALYLMSPSTHIRGLVDNITVSLPVTTTGVITLDESAAFRYTINSTASRTLVGTASGTLRRNNDIIAGLNDQVWNTTSATDTATANNTIAVGDRVTLTLSGNSNFKTFGMSVNYTRNS